MVLLYALAQGRQPAARGQHARADILNKKTSFNPSPGKATTERRSNFENLWAADLWRQILHYYFIL